jgi:hypothetical protein
MSGMLIEQINNTTGAVQYLHVSAAAAFGADEYDCTGEEPE